MKIPEICGYCGGKVIFTDSAILYGGVSRGDVYLCTNCNASVGVHKGTNRPYGTLANAALKLKRRETHVVFDQFWKNQQMTRTNGYKWLAQQMQIPEYRAHIGIFDMQQCEQVLQICYKNQNENVA